MYKDNADTIIGNCDSSLFLGGKEETTLKRERAAGKETIDMYNTSVTKGHAGVPRSEFPKAGQRSDVHGRACRNGRREVSAAGARRPAFLSRKYDITKHPNYKYLSDFNPKNTFDIEKYLSTRLRVRPDDCSSTMRSACPNWRKNPQTIRIGPPIYKFPILFGGPCFFMPILRRCLLVRSRDSPEFTHSPQEHAI